MDEDDTKLIDMAKYPFLGQTGNYLSETHLTLEDLGNSDWKPAIVAAYDRIRASADSTTYNPNLQMPEIEILSFIISIILLRGANIPTFNRRFSLAEAMRAQKFLEKDLYYNKERSVLTNAKLIRKTQQHALDILRNEFDFQVVIEDDFFKVKITDYLKRAVHFHEKEWKLVNRRVENGLVFLSSHETVRLIRKELNERISSRIKTMPIGSIPETFQQYITDIKNHANKILESVVFSGEYPPCVKHGIEVLEKGENLPHSGRFLLATYLLSKGQTVDQIAPLFKNAPDYNERTTKYQLEHISGSSGSGTKYQCPSCEKLRSENLCFATPDCDGIINPVQFGKKRKSP